jgi:hypothetical protein
MEPFVIYRGVNRDGETFALDPRAGARLREALGPAAHVRSRLFMAHETTTRRFAVRSRRRS